MAYCCASPPAVLASRGRFASIWHTSRHTDFTNSSRCLAVAFAGPVNRLSCRSAPRNTRSRDTFGHSRAGTSRSQRRLRLAGGASCADPDGTDGNLGSSPSWVTICPVGAARLSTKAAIFGRLAGLRTPSVMSQ